MRTVNVTVPVTPTACPTGISPGGIIFSISNAADNSLVVAEVMGYGVLSCSFSGISDGEYIMTAQAQDSTGALLGAAVSTPFTVTDLPYNQPVGALSITLV